jgi:MFS family permease
MVVQGWLVYDLTGKARYLGLLGLVTAVPTILLNLVGGVAADRMDQRRLLMTTQTSSAVLMILLGTLVLLDIVQIWHILSIAFFAGAVLAFDSPSRQSLYPHLIDRKDLMNAVALNSTIWQGTRIIGPAIAGIMVWKIGLASGFYAAAAGFLVLVVALSFIRIQPIRRETTGNVRSNMGEGIRFVTANRLFTFLIGMTFFNSFFGMSYVFLLPIFARDILDVGPQGLGFLQTGSGLGALLMTFIAATLGKSPFRGRLLIGGATLFGFFLILFAYSEDYYTSMILLFMAGASSSLYMILVMTTLQSQVPDHLRGRVMGLYGMTWSLMPLGAMQAGFIADWFGAPVAVAIGGFMVSAFAILVGATNHKVRNMGN